MFLLLDLPAFTPLVDLSKMAALDMGKRPKVEEWGEMHTENSRIHHQ